MYVNQPYDAIHRAGHYLVDEIPLLPRSYGSARYFISTHTHMEKEGAITQHDSACIYVHMYSRRIRDGDFAYIS